MILGLGFVNDSRALVALDSSTGLFSILGLIPGYMEAMAGTTAVDAKQRVFYALLHNSSSPTPSHYPSMDLVQLDLSRPGAPVRGNPRACEDCTLCPNALVGG